MPKGKIKAVIYDCDGVIVNSDDAIITYYSWIAEKSGITLPDLSDEAFKRVLLSYTEDGIINELAKGDKKVKEKIYHVIATENYPYTYENIILEDNLISALDILKERDILLAVDTNRGSSLPNLLTHFKINNYFSYLITSCDVKEPKPSPEGIYKICDYFNVAPIEVLFLGDSMTDYYAAKESGAFFLAYKNNLNNAQIIFDHRDIIKYLN